MQIVIGIQTCERLNFTKKTIETLLYHNSGIKEMPIVVSDDNSTDGTLEYIAKQDFINDRVIHKERVGITKAYQDLINLSAKYGDILLYLQNDWQCVRKIDFNAIRLFYEEKINTGHINTIVYKGEKKEWPCRSSAEKPINSVTQERIITQNPITKNMEIFIPGNWSYVDLPGFTRIDIALKMFDKSLKYPDKKLEGLRMLNIHLSNCENYLLDNQAFRNLDPYKNSKNRTPCRKK